MKLILVCVECGIVAHAPFDDQKLLPGRVYQELGWLLTMVDAKEGVLAPLCGACAERIYPPELLKEAIELLKAVE